MNDQLQLYDRLSDEVRPFRPIGEPVKMYVCGLTPYDATHLGHAFTFAAFDVLIRYLQYLGHTVRYVQNVTDVDDPLFARARELGIPYQELARHEIARYLQDIDALNVRRPDIFPHASDEIPGIIDLVSRLLDSGNAYQVDGSVYFSIATDPQYGELSRCTRAEMIGLARERGGNPDDPRRRDPLDFSLWRPAQPGEPTYESPWGSGLPGWHIECSAMALTHLGEQLDIHGGGADLIFPHHESEIAQSEAATGRRPFSRFWMHAAMVYLGGEKMSKSLGNMVFVRDLVPRWGANAVRVYLASCHYRSELHYDTGALAEAAAVAAELADAAINPGGAAAIDLGLDGFRSRFMERMNADLDTPGAIGVLRELARAIHTARHHGRDVTGAQRLLRELGAVLGLRLDRQAVEATGS